MTTYRLIALDLDGTLLNKQNEISPQNLQAIRQAIDVGVKVIVSTGRGIQNILPILQKYNLQLPIVAVNGSEVWESPNILRKRNLMPVGHVKQLHQVAVEHDLWWWSYAVEGAFNKEKWVDSIDHIQWLKFGFASEDDQLLHKLRNHLQALDMYELTNSHHDNIEINPKGISKASGVREICQMFQISMSEVIAIGDSGNDLSMIRAAGLGVAMGNASENVKQHADVITLTNDEHGVAEIIHTYVLSR
jgi:HAD superfamily hydrolase (TIGR01484 family)